MAFSFENNSCRNSVIYAKIQKRVEKRPESPLPLSGLQQSGFHEEGAGVVYPGVSSECLGGGGECLWHGLWGDPDSPVKGVQTHSAPLNQAPRNHAEGVRNVPEIVPRIEGCQTKSLCQFLIHLPPLGETCSPPTCVNAYCGVMIPAVRGYSRT